MATGAAESDATGDAETSGMTGVDAGSRVAATGLAAVTGSAPPGCVPWPEVLRPHATATTPTKRNTLTSLKVELA